MTSDVKVITSEEIENSDALTLQELLQSKAGIFIGQAGQTGAASSLRLRGLPTGFSKIILDNVELTDPTDINNSYQINNLTLDNIESIEILKGSQSIIYGSSAIGGVLKINTKKGFDSTQMRAEYGSQNTKKVALSKSGNTKQLNYGINLSYLDTDGYSAYNEDRITNAEDDSYESLNANLNLSYFLGNNLEVSFQSGYIKSDLEKDDFMADKIDNDDEQYEHFNNYLSLKYFSDDDKFTLTPSVRLSQIERVDEFGFTPLFKGKELDTRIDSTYELSQSAKLFIGTQYLKQEDTINKDYSELFSIYGTTNLSYGDLFADVGMRLDQFTSFDLNTIGSLGIGYNLTNTWTLKGHFSQGFKLPTLYQLANQLSDLDPTDSVNTELTLLYKEVTYQFEATAFNYELRNQIDYDTATSKYFNISRSRIQGMEFSYTQEFRFDLTVTSSLTLQRAKNLKTNGELGRTPHSLASIDFTYKINKNQSLTNWWQYVGKRQDSGEMPSYVVGNLNYQYKDFNFKIMNILDKDYENVRYYGTLPRSFYVGYKLNL